MSQGVWQGMDGIREWAPFLYFGNGRLQFFPGWSASFLVNLVEQGTEFAVILGVGKDKGIQDGFSGLDDGFHG